MKAKVKSTGKIIDVTFHSFSTGDNGGLYRVYTRNDDVTRYSENELDFEDTIDWEQRRYEISKEMLPTIQSINAQVGLRCGKVSSDEEVVGTAIRLTDELISQLKK